jgi:hypothetical protein
MGSKMPQERPPDFTERVLMRRGYDFKMLRRLTPRVRFHLYHQEYGYAAPDYDWFGRKRPLSPPPPPKKCASGRCRP